MIQKREVINDFITEVFSTFNGIVNPINIAELDINWADLINTNAGGYSKTPNIVIINAAVILRFNDYDEECVKSCIVETVIHELFHCDQIIDYRRYGSDADYTNYIEHACQVMTYLFMSTNTGFVNRLLGFDINPEIYKDCLKYWQAPGVYYNRRTYVDHVFMCLSQLAYFTGEELQALYETLMESFCNPNDFTLVINGEYVCVKKGYTFMSLFDLNSVLKNYSCTGTVFSDWKVETDGMDTIIYFGIKVTNLMCRAVKK